MVPYNRIGGLYAEATTFSLPSILQQVAWYWHTQSYGRALWPYRVGWEAVLRDAGTERLPSPLAVRDKPVGYSWFPYEALGVAESWLGEWFGEGLVFFRRHGKVCGIHSLVFLGGFGGLFMLECLC